MLKNNNIIILWFSLIHHYTLLFLMYFLNDWVSIFYKRNIHIFHQTKFSPKTRQKNNLISEINGRNCVYLCVKQSNRKRDERTLKIKSLPTPRKFLSFHDIKFHHTTMPFLFWGEFTFFFCNSCDAVCLCQGYTRIPLAPHPPAVFFCQFACCKQLPSDIRVGLENKDLG